MRSNIPSSVRTGQTQKLNGVLWTRFFSLSWVATRGSGQSRRRMEDCMYEKLGSLEQSIDKTDTKESWGKQQARILLIGKYDDYTKLDF